MESTEKEQERPACERCGAMLTPIVYGYPTFDTFEAAERGEVVLGGCVVWDGQPRNVCRSCRNHDHSRG